MGVVLSITGPCVWRTERGGRWIGTMNDGPSERTNEDFLMYVSLKSLGGDRRSPPCPPWVSFFPSHFHCNYIGAHCKFSLNSYLCAKSRAASPVKWVEEYSRCLGHLMSLVYVYRHVYVLNQAVRCLFQGHFHYRRIL